MVQGWVLEGASVLSSSPLSPIFSLRLPDPFVPFSTPLSLSNDFSGVNKFPSGSIGVVSCLKGVMSLAVKPSQEIEGVSLLRASQNNPSEAFVPEKMYVFGVRFCTVGRFSL